MVAVLPFPVALLVTFPAIVGAGVVPRVVEFPVDEVPFPVDGLVLAVPFEPAGFVAFTDGGAVCGFVCGGGVCGGVV